MGIERLVVFLLCGLFAGWLAGMIVKGKGFGLVVNLIIGIVGAFLGSFIFGILGIYVAPGILGMIIVSLVGAIVLLFIAGLVNKKRR